MVKFHFSSNVLKEMVDSDAQHVTFLFVGDVLFNVGFCKCPGNAGNIAVTAPGFSACPIYLAKQ